MRRLDLATDQFDSRLSAVRWHADENDKGNCRRDTSPSDSQKPHHHKDRSAMVKMIYHEQDTLFSKPLVNVKLIHSTTLTNAFSLINLWILLFFLPHN